MAGCNSTGAKARLEARREPINVRCGQMVYSCCELPAATSAEAPAEFIGRHGAVRRDAHARFGMAVALRIFDH